MFAVGKLGLLGKLALISGLNHLVLGGGGDSSDAGAVLVALIPLVWVGVFAVTRVRRRLHGRTLPPLVWEGTRADRRNADLKWFAWPVSIVMVFSGLVTSGELSRGETPTALVWVLSCVGVLAVIWSLRLGDARNSSFWSAARRSMPRLSRR